MKIEAIPFNALLGIQRGAAPFILELPGSPQLTNHLATVHASAQLALAEATSGQIFISHCGDRADQTFAVVRRLEAKFKSPLRGRILSWSSVADEVLDVFAETLTSKGRASVSIPIEVLDESQSIGLVATVEWFAQYQTVKSSTYEV